MNVIKMTVQEWAQKGTELFGEHKLQWKFCCPVCETVIKMDDYLKAKAPLGAIAYSCIGRYLKGSQKAFSEKKIIKGKPCDYTSGGLFNISPIEIDGERYFDFYCQLPLPEGRSL
jgi:hypothetical protein